MVAPEPLLAPVIPPEMAPKVQLKLLGAEAISVIFGPVPLQIMDVLDVVIIGAGLTVTVMV